LSLVVVGRFQCLFYVHASRALLYGRTVGAQSAVVNAAFEQQIMSTSVNNPAGAHKHDCVTLR
jgi:hypothetical protein